MDSESSVLARQAQLPAASVQAVCRLLDEDHTVPFIARYRKEATGGLDEVEILLISDLREKRNELEKRRQAVISSLQENGFWSEELGRRILSAESLIVLEDLYLPYRPKRKTRASVAREKGLEPLADLILANRNPSEKEISAFLSVEKGVLDESEALQGARDVVAERISERSDLRARLRESLLSQGILESKKARGAPSNSEFQAFEGKTEKLTSLPSHRLLGLLRGVQEGALSIGIVFSPDRSLEILSSSLQLKTAVLCSELRTAMQDSWARLLRPTLENEVLKQAKEKADVEAVEVFASNLRELLLSPPLGQKAILAVDPGLRTGCKVAVLSAQGNLLGHDVVYPLEPHKKIAEAGTKVLALVERHQLQAVAVGNGTGGREAIDFLRGLGLKIPVVSVSESGASVYSASEIAREEFPDQDLTVRGAVSIGRRLLDPLAELVKLDPKVLGVGQYQHDVDQKLLKKKLEEVVVSCVNRVGVDINTASKPLLTYVAGLNAKTAASLVAHRTAHGAFESRDEVRKVKGLGQKTFEQAAGFLRIRGGGNVLDSTAVHPESYGLVQTIARELGSTVENLVGRSGLLPKILPLQKKLQIGELSLKDIVIELEKPGLDPRAEWEGVTFDPLVRTMADLKEGQILNGVVTNVTAFGAFVDVGVHQDGLVHVSQLSDFFVKDPTQVVKAGQKVRVRVLAIEPERKRISLSRKGLL